MICFDCVYANTYAEVVPGAAEPTFYPPWTTFSETGEVEMFTCTSCEVDTYSESFAMAG